MVFSGQNMSVVRVNTYQCCAYGKGNIAYQYIPSASKAKNLKINYKKIIVFNFVIFLKMNEQVGESGANRWETEQEKACKKQGEKNAVQVDLLVRRRQVYPKKPRYNLLTPNH